MTIYDIATNLGVSAATVSLALNGDRRVAEKTRGRILEYADKHGFKRNEQARNFRLRRYPDRQACAWKSAVIQKN